MIETLHALDIPPQDERLRAVRVAQNPLLEAAQPLLRALADMPATLDAEGVPALALRLEREVASFQSLCSDAQIRHEHVVAASYALCTALDEAANSTSWGGTRGSDHGQAGVWAARQLAAGFHGDTKGGDKFFLLVGRLASQPHAHIDLLELMYQVLGLGFEGRFGSAADGRRQLDTVRHRLFTLLSGARGEVAQALSPHWVGVGAGRRRILRRVPVWATFALLALVLSGVFGLYKYRLLRMTGDASERIAAVGRLRPTAEAATPAPPVHRALRLRELLAAEIANGTVSVVEDEQRSAVRFRGDAMFVAGQARLAAHILPVLAKVAAEIGEVPGTVRVTGHSDNQPIHTREFPDNMVLSEKRAAAVAAVLLDHGVAASRVQSEGRGATQPVADSRTPAGRARNRRVEIVVTTAPSAH